MYASAADIGCCMMVNRKHPADAGGSRCSRIWPSDRGPLSARHRLLESERRKAANERFAAAFGLSFLMPAASVRQRFHEIVAASNDFQVADLCRLSHYYFVSVEAMALRLEQLQLIPKGSWALIKESKFAPRQAAAMLNLPAREETLDYYPERYKFLAVQAFEREKISEEQLRTFSAAIPSARGKPCESVLRDGSWQTTAGSERSRSNSNIP